jgi:hypothetical protein
MSSPGRPKKLARLILRIETEILDMQRLRMCIPKTDPGHPLLTKRIQEKQETLKLLKQELAASKKY